jgi:hypothetical protein
MISKEDLIRIVRNYFPDPKSEVKEKRGIVLEEKISISEDKFIHIYVNRLTGKKSYGLIFQCHPDNNPNQHLTCDEPPIEKFFEEVKGIPSK